MNLKQEPQSKLVRIGVFYDGNYFLHVSNYYLYEHERQARIDIHGLHDFIRNQIADVEGTEERYCKVVDAHYFRGRVSAQEASKTNRLLYDRIFDDILMREGVVTHYLPIRMNQGKKQEKGIDVWLALEALELAIYKQFSTVVLIASDGDYVPLVRKLNTLGIRVMLLSWDFEYMTDTGVKSVTRTSQDLLEEVTYPVAMHELIDNRVKRNDPLVMNLFVKQDFKPMGDPIPTTVGTTGTSAPTGNGTGTGVGTGIGITGPEVNAENFGNVYSPARVSNIINLLKGYGFISAPPNNIFFSYRDLVDCEFSELRIGDPVEFMEYKGENGEPRAANVRKAKGKPIITPVV